MELFLNEQDVVDSVCVYAAYRDRTEPQYVEADLRYDENLGISAAARAEGSVERHLNEHDVVDAIAEYLQEYHNFIAANLLVELLYNPEKGIHASVMVQTGVY
ncbi:DUF2653 family protein [Neobacillus terrae]|uniref:DUF2653 family protein n=1 Tax=Neobacillus terrae TaxID=3034837 RepID=UPI001408165D|nr:DUF2653 family protein [Neobacillus terrae]NHM30175.1 DUF2653 family protein [Neobacillus terrae]